MRSELLQLAAELSRKGEPFVLAMVVRRESYSSAQQGDMAVITADGGYHGWLGGNCTRPAVRREAMRALADGKPRLVALSPEPEQKQRPGVTALPMTCHSGGSVDIYLEPVLPAPRLLLFGVSPAIRALAQLGKALGYGVDVVDPAATAAEVPAADRVFTDLSAPELRAKGSAAVHAVVATMGENDEDAVAAALSAGPSYLAVVASRNRFALIRETLLARGIPAGALEGIKNPAGLDIGARLPEEVALSILAEIVQLRRSAPRAQELSLVEERTEIDPVCGMTVAVASEKPRAEHGGRTFWFCNPRCREKFLADPGRYLGAAAQAR